LGDETRHSFIGYYLAECIKAFKIRTHVALNSLCQTVCFFHDLHSISFAFGKVFGDLQLFGGTVDSIDYCDYDKFVSYLWHPVLRFLSFTGRKTLAQKCQRITLHPKTFHHPVYKCHSVAPFV
jgi:hypothetical protein